MRPSLRNGLPYGWWRNTDVWAATITALSLGGLLVFAIVLLVGWFL